MEMVDALAIALQGGRGITAAEGGSIVSPSSYLARLQGGRGITAAEGCWHPDIK